MASTSNPLEEILNSDVADSPFSSLVRPIQPSISPSTSGRDNIVPVPVPGVLIPSSNHLYGGPSPVLQANSSGAVASSSSSSNGASLSSSAAIQTALLHNHHPPDASVGSKVTGVVTKGFNNGMTSSQSPVAAVAPGPPRAGPLNIQVKSDQSRHLLTSSSSGEQLLSSSSVGTTVGGVVAPQTVVVTVANPTAASLAQTLGNFLNAAQFKQSNIAAAGLSKPNSAIDQKPMVTNIGGGGGSGVVVPTLGSTMPAQVISQLHPSQHIVSNMVSMAQVKTDSIAPTAANLKPFAVAGQQPLTAGQQTLIAGQQQNLTLIQSAPQQGAVGFPSQHVQVVNVPTQNVQRTAVAPVPNLRTLAPRIALNQPVRIQQQQAQNLPMIRSQNVVAGQISFAPGVQQNLLQGNMVLIKNERGQMMLLQNQPQQASASSSPVIQSVQQSQARLPGQLGLVQPNTTGQGLIAVSSVQTQFIQPTMAAAAAVRMSSSSQGLVPMQTATSMVTPQQQQQQTALQSAAFSTPSIVSRLVPQGGIAQMTSSQSATSTSAAVVASANVKDIQENVRKCKNFLSTLMKLASNQPKNVVDNVKNLIQGLIDGRVEPEDFTNQLQKELKSSPQPYLVPFLRKSLPFLRHSLFQNKMMIDGIRPPPASVASAGLSLMTTVAATVPAFSAASSVSTLRPRPVIPNQLTTSKPLVPTTLTPQQQQLRLTMLQQQQQHHHQLGGLRMVGPKPTPPSLTADQTKNLLTRPALFSMPTGVSATHSAAAAATATNVAANATITTNGLLPQMSASISAVPHKGEKRKYEAMRDDDDINDVATMGGVNLTEESRNILATNSELVSGQLRSCKDEKFLETQVLMPRISNIVQRKGLDSTSQEVASVLSHAVQDHLRTLIEQLSLYVTHRLENYRTDSRFEMANDRRVQLKFLEDLGSIERKRHEETERGILMRAAKSRAKAEDPEQAKLKERAKAMQQAEMEEIRHRESNLTALAAIGPRKPRTAQDSSGSTESGSPFSKTIVPMRPRIKRVNLRDLLFLMEQKRESRRSTMLYKAFLK